MKKVLRIKKIRLLQRQHQRNNSVHFEQFFGWKNKVLLKSNFFVFLCYGREHRYESVTPWFSKKRCSKWDMFCGFFLSYTPLELVLSMDNNPVSPQLSTKKIKKGSCRGNTNAIRNSMHFRIHCPSTDSTTGQQCTGQDSSSSASYRIRSPSDAHRPLSVSLSLPRREGQDWCRAMTLERETQMS